MSSYHLIPHPDSPSPGVTAVCVQALPIQGSPTEYSFEFQVEHDGSLLLPPMLKPGRADNLWKTTCCEVFLMPGDGPDYIELNLSPSFRWAAYAFDGHRTGMRHLDLAFDPKIEITPETPGHFGLAAELDISWLEGRRARVNLTAVVEEIGGAKSFWALAHAPGPPDFHNADCFIARLPAPSAS